MQKELLRMENIVKTFPGVKALNNAAITVHAGEVMGFMGENGAGKSTPVSYTHLDVYKRQVLLFIGNVPRGVFCEQSSQKTRESQREIMRMHDFCASRSVLLVTG